MHKRSLIFKETIIMRRNEHTVKQDVDHYIETRLFRPEQLGSMTSSDNLNDSNLRAVKESKIFSNNGTEFLGKPPEKSVYSIAMLSKDKYPSSDYQYNLENWITVFCINPKEKDIIVNFFKKYGEISNVIPPSNNYMSLEFVNSTDVEKIMSENKPIIINSSNAVICKRGRYSSDECQPDKYSIPHYQTIKERIQSEVTFWELIQDFFHFIKWNFY